MIWKSITIIHNEGVHHPLNATRKAIMAPARMNNSTGCRSAVC